MLYIIFLIPFYIFHHSRPPFIFTSTTMKKLAQRVILVIIILALIAGAVAIRMHRAQQSASVKDAEMQPWALRAIPVKKRDIAKGFPVLAKVLASEEQTISGQLQGVILTMGPREGNAVKKGDVLATIDTREIDQQIIAQEAKLSAAEADLVNKREQYDRLKKILKKGGASVADVDAAQAAKLASQHTVESLKRLIEGLKVRRSYGRVTAPSDGTIAARLAEPGNICSVAHPLYRITVARGARVQVSLPQQIISQLHPGSLLEIQYGKKKQSLKLTRIFPALDARALGLAGADIPNAPFGLKSGARVPGRVILDERKNALVLPHSAVLISPNDPHKGIVFVTNSNEKNDKSKARHLRKVPVTIDLNTASGLAIIGDIKPGDLAISAHDAVLRQLHDGDLVQITVIK